MTVPAQSCIVRVPDLKAGVWRVTSRIDGVIKKYTVPLSPEDLKEFEADRLRLQRENSPEYIRAELDRRASKYEAEVFTLDDGFAVHIHLDGDADTVLIKASTERQLSYVLGILLDEIH